MTMSELEKCLEQKDEMKNEEIDIISEEKNQSSDSNSID